MDETIVMKRREQVVSILADAYADGVAEGHPDTKEQADRIFSLFAPKDIEWVGAEEVEQEGWYWVDEQRGEEPELRKIRNYRNTMCIMNWEISGYNKYCGPISLPPKTTDN
jgi:hypothetical protein